MKSIGIVLLALLISSCSPSNDQSIRLKVEQTIRIPVEYASITVGIEEKAKQATIVEQNGYDHLAEVVATLNKLGFEKQQLEIQSGETSSRWFDEESYEFEATVKFDLWDLDKLDTYRRALTKAGASRFRVSSFKNSKEDSLYDAAYLNAIDKAKQKAERLLASQTVSIGRILNLSENIRDVIEIDHNMEPPPLKLHSQTDNVEIIDPLYNKDFYTKRIEFTIEFGLAEK